MAFYFSSDTNALYDTDVFPVASLPANKVEITSEAYAELLTKQNQGYVILADGSGNPYTVNQSEASATDIKHAASVATTLALGHVKIGNTMEAANDGTLDLKDGSVTTAKIVDANVTADKLASNSVTTAKITDANVTADKLASDSVTSTKIADGAVTTAKIVDANVTADKLASNSVTTAKITDANVTADKLASNSVTTAKITDANVTADKLASDSVTTEKIADNAITNDKLDSLIKINRVPETNSLGHIVLDPIKPLQAQVSFQNTIYEVRKYINLSGGSLAFPPGSILYVNGGSIGNGTIVGNDTQVIAPDRRVFFDDLSFSGSFAANAPRVEWFGGSTGNLDNSSYATKCLAVFGEIEFLRGSYNFSSSITTPDLYTIKGKGVKRTILNLTSDIDFLEITRGTKLKDLTIQVDDSGNDFSHTVLKYRVASGLPGIYSDISNVFIFGTTNDTCAFSGTAITLESAAPSSGIAFMRLDNLMISGFGVAIYMYAHDSGWINENNFKRLHIRACPCAVRMYGPHVSDQIASNVFEISYQNYIHLFNSNQKALIQIDGAGNLMSNVSMNTFKGFLWDLDTLPDTGRGAFLRHLHFNEFILPKIPKYRGSSTSWQLIAIVPSQLQEVTFSIEVFRYARKKARYEFSTYPVSNVTKIQCIKAINLSDYENPPDFKFKYIAAHDSFFVFCNSFTDGFYDAEVKGDRCFQAPYLNSVETSDFPLTAVDIDMPSFTQDITVPSDAKLALLGTLTSPSGAKTLADFTDIITNTSISGGVHFLTATGSSLGVGSVEIMKVILFGTGNAYNPNKYGDGSSFIAIGSVNIYHGIFINDSWSVSILQKNS